MKISFYISKHKSAFKIITIFVIFIITLGIIFFPKINRVYNHYKRLDQIADKVEKMLDEKDYDLQMGLGFFTEADIAVSAIQKEVQPYYTLLKITGYIPWIGGYARQIEPIIEYTSHMFSAARESIMVGTMVMDKPLYFDGKSHLVQSIIAAQPQISSIEQELIQAGEFYNKVEPDYLPDRVSQKIDKLELSRSYLTELLDIINALSIASGKDKAMMYLILLQNADEIRPTGGYISAFGLMQIDQGTITLLEFEDSSSSDYISHIIEPPKPLKQILIAHYWLPRDANWSPSFPESARTIEDMYYQASGIKADGVIAINQFTIQQLLELTGPVDAEGEEVGSENILQYMMDKKMEAINTGKSASRKNFIDIIGKKLIEKIPTLTGREKLTRLANSLLTIAEQGNVFFYSNNSDVQKIIQKYGIDGNLRPGEGDFLMVVDGNLGYNKNDLVIERSIEYTVDLSEIDHPASQVVLNYTNPLKGDMDCIQADISETSKYYVQYIFPSCYWNYFRILGSMGTKVLSYELPDFSDEAFRYSDPWPHVMDMGTIGNSTTFAGGLLILPPDQASSVIIKRSLPETVVSENDGLYTYTLIFQKQSGIQNLPLELNVILPEGYEINQMGSNINLQSLNGEWVWTGSIQNYYNELVINFGP